MKKVILTLLVTLVIFNAHAQDKDSSKESAIKELIDSLKSNDIKIPTTKDYFKDNKLFPIVLDYENKNSFRLPKKIKKGDLYQIIVANINLNRYSISIKSKDSVFKTEALSMPTFASFSLDALNALTAGFNISNSAIAAIDIMTVDTLIPNNNIQDYHLFSTDIKTTKNSQLKNNSTVEEIFAIQTSTSQKQIKYYEMKLMENARAIDSLKYTIYKYRLDQLASDTSYLADATIKYSSLIIVVDKLRKDIKETQVHATQDYEEFKKYLDDKVVKKYLKGNEDANTLASNILKAYELTIKKNNELLEQIAAEKIVSLMTSILYLNKPNYFKSFPIQYTGDLEEVTITKSPRDTSGILDTEVITFSFPLNKKYEYWNVGTSFYYSTLKNDRYSTLATPVNDSTNVYRVIDEGRSQGEAGISVNLRYGYKLPKCEKWGFHLAMGPGISIEKEVRPRLLSGLGVSYGEKHNLVIDFGIITGYVERKSKIVDFSKDYNEIPNSTITALKTGYYFSFGYTFNM